MKKNSLSESGIFNSRIVLTLSLWLAGLLLATFSFAGPKANRDANGKRAQIAQAAPSSFGDPDPTVPGNPRYQIFYAPAGSSAETGSGEFNVGFNPFSKHIFVMNHGPIWRLTTPELLSPALPECCEALWEDKSAATTNTGLDPILWTDQKTGRTFASNSTAGANVVYGYTDTAAPFNDGDTWVQVAISPPNGGVDHQTIGSGPYPASLSVLNTPVNQGEYVLYCSQDAIGSMCQRSDDLGASYGPGVIATGPGTMNSQGCGGLHGHVHISPDGTAWLPDKSCGTKVGGAFTLDAGTTPWTEFSVPGTSASGQGSDPSIAFDEDSTIYFCYVNGQGTENHAHVAVGKRNGSTINWLRDVDVGASQGIVNVVFPQAVAGSAGRAACGFIGTNVAGSFQEPIFNGDWYPFVATTYDEGQTWVTVNATPNDPVQRHKGVCLQGIDCSSSTSPRNLLDFNEITMDDQGRVLFGYDDGCVSPGCVAGTKGNDDTAYMRVARQAGGKTLLAQFDPIEPLVPKAACLSGTRDCSAVHLTWKTPDNGGSDIVNYQIFRSTTAGAETFLGQTGNANTTFDDPVDPSVRHYFYVVKAVNGVGISVQSNEIDMSSELLAADDATTTLENQPVTINVLANDCGLPPLTVTATSTPTHGTVAINGDGTLLYTPPAGFFGPDNFSYTVRNAPGATLTRKVHIDVLPLCPPVATGSFSDSFDPTVDKGWTVDTAVNNVPASAPWTVTPDPSSHSAPASFFSDASTLDTKDDRLLAPPQNLSSTSHLIFWHRFQTEAGYDGGVVEVSTDGGSTWVDVIAGGGSFVGTGGYNGTISPSFGSPIAGRPAWTDGDATAAMSKVEIDLGAFAGYEVRVRFRLACDPVLAGSLPGAGWWIDDVQFTNTLVEGTCPTVGSRKAHGAARIPFDVDLPLTGAPGIECRTAGANNTHTIVFTFATPLTNVAGASVTGGTGSVVGRSVGTDPHQYFVELSGVTNAQRITLTLTGVTDSAGALTPTISVPIGVLAGDTTANGAVNSSDIAQTQSQSGQPVSSANFREDVTLNGAINSSDISFVQSKSGTGLP